MTQNTAFTQPDIAELVFDISRSAALLGMVNPSMNLSHKPCLNAESIMYLLLLAGLVRLLRNIEHLFGEISLYRVGLPTNMDKSAPKFSIMRKVGRYVTFDLEFDLYNKKLDLRSA